VVHDFAREPGDADVAVEARGAQPQDASEPVGVSLAPEADVMAAARAPADHLLEGEILGPPLRDEVGAHRSRRVRPVEENATRVGEPALERDAVGRRPSGGAHRDDDVAAGPE